MSKIPIHKIEKLSGEMAFLRYISDNTIIPPINYAHRDDYYIFVFMEKGEVRLFIDFEEHEIKGPTILCTLPGQVHFPISYANASGWILAVDSTIIKDEYKTIFEKKSIFKSNIQLSEAIMNDLKSCLSILNRRINSEKQSIEQSILETLLSSYIGMFAEVYQKGFPVLITKRMSAITCQFKSLLSANYKSLKSPSQYASKMNLSPVYLNEAVKKTSGLTVSECIQNEIMLHAKRLLFYTQMSVKEIALELGYEDWAYFTRLFTKVTSFSPTLFRKKYLK